MAAKPLSTRLDLPFALVLGAGIVVTACIRPTSSGQVPVGSSPSAGEATASLASPTPTADALSCAGRDPTDHVYRPARLIVLQPCATVTGTVVAVRGEADGDVHIQLRLDAGQEGLLSRGNVAEQSSTLVLEIVCVGTVTQPDAVTACANYANPVAVPAVGSHISATGPYVHDTAHDWREIHPVWSVQSVTQP